MKRKRLIAILIAGISCLVISSIGVTIAWYYNGVFALVDNFNISLKAEPNLLLSTSYDGEFKETLTKDDLKKVDSFSPVSSMYSSLWKDKQESSPKFVDNYAHVTSDQYPIYATTGYFSQDIYLYSKDDIYVTIDNSAIMFKEDEQKNAEAYEKVKGSYPQLSKEEIIANLNKIKESLRVSILIPDTNNYQYFIIDPYKNEETLFAGILDTDYNGYFDYTDGTNSSEIIYGDYSNEDKFVFDSPSSQDIPYTGINTCFNSAHKKDVKLFNLQKSIDNGATLAKEGALSLQEVEDKIKIPLLNEKPTKIVLSIYLEGWDKDNTNLMMYASFLANIQFKVKGEI